MLHQQITAVLGLFLNFSQVQNLNGESVETSDREIFVQRILFQHFLGQTDENDDKSIRIACVWAEHVGYYKYERALTNLMRHLVMSIQVSVILLGFHKKHPTLGACAKLRKATVSFVMSVRPPAWYNSLPTGRIFVKFGI